MAEKAKETKKEEVKEEKKSGGGMMKMIIMGVAGIVVVTGLAVGVMMFMDPGQTAEETTEHATDSTKTEEHDSDNITIDDSDLNDEELLSEENPDVLKAIMDQLAELDVDVTQEVVEMENKMSVEDSLKSVNWLDEEKAKLAERENAVAKKERDLQRLDKEVTQKVLKIEQAESARITQLAKLYDGMDPRSVAALMANLDDKTVVAILPRMKTKNASNVLALLPAKRAAKLSQELITIAGN